jgi:hypothetical protein
MSALSLKKVRITDNREEKFGPVAVVLQVPQIDRLHRADSVRIRPRFLVVTDERSEQSVSLRRAWFRASTK